MKFMQPDGYYVHHKKIGSRTHEGMITVKDA